MRGMTVTMFNKHVENCHTAVGRLLFAWVTVVLRRCMVPHDQRFRHLPQSKEADLPATPQPAAGNIHYGAALLHVNACEGLLSRQHLPTCVGPQMQCSHIK